MEWKKLIAVLLAAGLMMTACAGWAESTETVPETETAQTEEIAPAEEAAQTEEAAPAEEIAQTEETAPAEKAAQTEETSVSETATEVMANSVSTDTQSEAEILEAVSDAQKLDAAYTLALNAINAEDYDTAREYINICFAYCSAESNPVVFADLLLKRACIDVIEEKYDMALLNLDAALRVQPELADAYLVRTQVYATLDDVERSISNLEQYIALTGDTSLYETVAQLQELRGDSEAAQAAYTKFAEGAGAGNEEVGFQNGLYLMGSDKYEEAIEAFQAYADNETYGAGAMYNIGVCRMNLGYFAEAVEAFTACEEKGGTFEGLYYNRGVCAMLSENWAGAAEDFTRSVETEPYVADATFYLGVCQMQTGDLEAAVKSFTAVIGDGEKTEDAGETADQPVNYGAYYYRAMCQAALGALEDAAADYTVCIENGYELGQCYYQRAQVYASLGDSAKQAEDLANSLKYAE